MWRCSNCGNGVEDKYAHCWQCGVAKPVKRPRQDAPSAPDAVPSFASYEELAKVPSRPIWIMRRGPLQRGVLFVVGILLIKIFSAPFLGKYGLYIVISVAVIALLIILWRFFRRDPSEGVGVKLN
jgi:hypothetical protein